MAKVPRTAPTTLSPLLRGWQSGGTSPSVVAQEVCCTTLPMRGGDRGRTPRKRGGCLPKAHACTCTQAARTAARCSTSSPRRATQGALWTTCSSRAAGPAKPPRRTSGCARRGDLVDASPASSTTTGTAACLSGSTPNPSQLVQTLPQLGEAIARKTRNAANAAFAGAIKVGTVLVLRVNSLEANVHGGPFFLAIASAEEGEKVVHEAPKTGLEGSNFVKKGQWLVRLRWLHYGKHGSNKDLPGARLHVHKPGEHSLLMPTEGIISNTQVVSAAQKLVRVEGKRPVWLLKEAVDVVLGNSNELLSQATTTITITGFANTTEPSTKILVLPKSGHPSRFSFDRCLLTTPWPCPRQGRTLLSTMAFL